MTNRQALVVVGGQWGDEGKAKVVDWLAQRANVVVRNQGGCNAGHTVQQGGQTYKFHHVPSGILYPAVRCVIGNGVVLHPPILKDELEALAAKGIALDQLTVSDRAHVTLPLHTRQDVAREQDESQVALGTTGRGIGPTYSDKVARLGLRVADLFEPDAWLTLRLTHLLAAHGEPTDQVTELLATCRQYAEWLAPYVGDTVALLQQCQDEGERLLFEGAQGTLLDVDFGSYPYVTSSNATAGGACTGSGVGPTRIGTVLGVMKAYLTRVGEGPFPTEQRNEAGEFLRTQGHEVGTTTGRPRRCGWFDAVLSRYAVQVNGLDALAITKLDVLDTLDEIPVCVAYRHRETGETWTHPPARLSLWNALEPVYETLPGWQQPITQCAHPDDLPAQAQAYLQRLEALTGCPVALVSTGPDREQTLLRRSVAGWW